MDAVFEELKRVNATVVKKAIEKYGTDVNNPFDDLRFGNPLPTCVVFAEKIAGTVFRHGDILVGFYADESTRFSMFIGGFEACSHDLSKGGFAFASQGRFVVPLICLRYHDVRVTSSTPIYCVFAYVQRDTRKYLCSNAFHNRLHDGSRLLFANGMAWPVMQKWQLDYCLAECIELPDLSFHQMGLSVERTRVLREDLAKKAWHPARVRQWCLEHDDEFCVSEVGVHRSKMYLDNVLLMDDFIADELSALLSLSPAPIPEVLHAIENELRRRHLTVEMVSVIDSSASHDRTLRNVDDQFSLVVFLDERVDTILVSGVTIKPKKGRCLIFEGHTLPDEVNPSTSIVACKCVYPHKVPAITDVRRAEIAPDFCRNLGLITSQFLRAIAWGF